MNKNKPNPQQINLNINLNDIEAMKCDCGCNIFIHFSQLKFISAFYTGTGQPMQVEIPRFVCTNPNCGLMYEKAMDAADIKKYARNPRRELFNWTGFFVTGMQLVKIALHEKAGKDHMEMIRNIASEVKNEKENS